MYAHTQPIHAYTPTTHTDTSTRKKIREKRGRVDKGSRKRKTREGRGKNEHNSHIISIHQPEKMMARL